jgi:transcriptional regulator with XRE-family HTH domain
MALTSEQVKAARALLGWSKLKLATRIGVTEKAISAFELGGNGGNRSIWTSSANGSRRQASNLQSALSPGSN